MTRLLPLALLLLAAACAGPRRSPGVPERYPAAEVPGALDAARTDLAEGRTQYALDRSHAAAAARGLEPELRQEANELLVEAADQRLTELAGPGTHPRRLEHMVDLELPRPIAVRAGVRAARLWFERGERQRAFELIEKIDLRYPQHFMRAEAAEVIADVAFSFAADPGRYLLLFKYRSLAFPALQYLVDNYPSAPRCDEAFATLARLYEEDHLWESAVENHEDLILWKPESPLAVASQAHIPRLRLLAQASPEYDRTELRVARSELERWLDDHGGGGHELEKRVEDDLVECLERLAESDLVIARFYERVHEPTGAEYHAARALEEARVAGDEERASQAEALLARARAAGAAP